MRFAASATSIGKAEKASFQMGLSMRLPHGLYGKFKSHKDDLHRRVVPADLPEAALMPLMPGMSTSKTAHQSAPRPRYPPLHGLCMGGAAPPQLQYCSRKSLHLMQQRGIVIGRVWQRNPFRTKIYPITAIRAVSTSFSQICSFLHPRRLLRAPFRQSVQRAGRYAEPPKKACILPAGVYNKHRICLRKQGGDRQSR